MKAREVFYVGTLYLFLTSIVLYNFQIGHWYNWVRWECNKWRPYYNLADKYINRQDIPNAIYNLSMAIECDSNRWEAYCNRAMCWMTVKEWDRALKDYQMALVGCNDKAIRTYIIHNINAIKQKGKLTSWNKL